MCGCRGGERRVQTDKIGNINIMLHFMQLAHPRHIDIYVQNSKHKSQNTELTSFEHRSQNICIKKHNVTYRLPYIYGSLYVTLCFDFWWSVVLGLTAL